MEVRIDDRELVALSRRLAVAGKYTEKNTKKVLTAIGLVVGRMAKRYSPKSMSKTQYVATLKGGKTKRKVFSSGALKAAITTEVRGDNVSIFVPSNTPAGDYAEKMHDEQGKTWWRLSSGKQPESQDKYIENAEKDTRDVYMKEVEKLIDDIIKAI